MKENKNSVFDYLCSVKLAIFLLIALSVTSIIGTLIPQGEPLNFYQEKFNPTFFYLIKLFQINDAYNSWWFLSLLNLFSINLICCTLKRFPFTMKILKKDILETDEEKLLRMPLKKIIDISEKSLKTIDFAAKIKQIMGNVKTKLLDDGAEIIASEKGKINYLGVYILHSSILIIFIGGILGSFLGFKGNLMLLEGEKSNQIINPKTSDEIALAFEVKCEKFAVEFYENTGMPKEFRSDLTIIENGNEVFKQQIIVNKPLKYKGITFYQASYQAVPELTLVIEKKDLKKEVLTLSAFDTINIPDTSLSLGILQFLPDVHGTPAARIWVTDGKDFTNSQWVLMGKSKVFGQGTDQAFSIYLSDVKEKFMTGLQVKKDPGVWIVWLGCSGLIFGFIVVFWVPHRKLWVMVKNNKIIIAGQTNKNQFQFDKDFETFTKKINAIII